MEKVSHRKIKMMPINYPPPYSRSWANVGQQKNNKSMQKNTNKTASNLKTQKPMAPRRIEYMSQPRFSSGLDPTVPHLKYGLFPKKQAYVNGAQSRTLSTKPSVRTTSQVTSIAKETRNLHRTKKAREEPAKIKSRRPSVAKMSTVQKFILNPKEKGEFEGPMFVFRPLERRHLRSLTLSNSTHLDIKPCRRPLLSPQTYRSHLYKNQF